MNIAIVAVVGLILAILGYVYILKEHSGENNKECIRDFMPNSKKRVAYLVLALLLCVGISIIFNTIYLDTNLLHRLKLISLLMLLYPIALIDYRKHIIPNRILLFGLALRGGYYIFELIFERAGFLEILKSGIIGGLVIAGFFLLFMFILKGSVGMGDIKLFGLMGLYQGLWGAFASVFVSLFVSFVYSMFLLITKRKTRKDAIPFGPSIFIGTLISIVMTGI